MSTKADKEIHLDARDLDSRKTQALLTGGIAPRPIALVSTMSKEGVGNLSPFSFFNAFGSNPPIVAFSPARRGRDGSLKDTYRNLMDTKECVIQAVTYSIVEQVNTASGEYPPDVDEFVKSGLTPLDSDVVKPKRVAESPFQMECKLYDMIHLGESNGSGNLAICEVLKFHISKSVMTGEMVDTRKIDHVGRNGAAYYTRAKADALFELPMPRGNLGVGYEAIPEFIRKSVTFTANDLGKLANANSIPSEDDVRSFMKNFESKNLEERTKALLRNILKDHSLNRALLEQAAREALHDDNLELAWTLILASAHKP